jgi:coenzyme F420-dependent glucose-6-phosphate dehydrogenase
LHTRAGKPPPLFVSAFHPEAARLAAIYGDGLWTLADPASAPALIEAFRAQRAEDGREPGEVILQALISWDVDDQAALEAARPWKGAQPSEYYVDDWHDPQAMYEHAEATITDDEFMKGAIISADASEHIRRLREIEEMGATIVAVMNCSGHDPEGAIRLYHETVLPALRTQT